MTSGASSPGWGGQQHPPIYVPPRPLPPVAPPPAALSGLPYPRGDHPPAGVFWATWPVLPPAQFVPPAAPPLPPSPARARHSPLRWLVAVVCLMCIAGFITFGAMVGVTDLAGLDRPTIAWRAPGAVVLPPPAADAPAAEWTDWARLSVDAAVRDQAAALLAKDETRFLAPVDPANEQLLADLTRRYSVLTQMGVGQWAQSVKSSPRSTGDRSWDADIKISYCFGAPTCRMVALTVGSEWQFKGDHLVLVDLDSSDANQMGPRPWEDDELTVGTGDRVVVAAARSNAWRVPDAVIAADRAAKVADTLAKWDPAPSRYVIFLAGPNDWQRWYGHEQPEWAAAWAVPVSGSVTEVVVRTQAVQQRGLEQLLTHELTHVTTLAGRRGGANRSAWWLIEGIADYATMIGRSIGEYDALAPTRSFVRGRWDGNPAVDPPSTDAALEEASARYGVAFLAVRRIADVYGQDKMLEFWGRIVHDNVTAENASSQVLGADWETVRADCADFIRTSVG